MSLYLAQQCEAALTFSKAAGQAFRGGAIPPDQVSGSVHVRQLTDAGVIFDISGVVTERQTSWLCNSASEAVLKKPVNI